MKDPDCLGLDFIHKGSYFPIEMKNINQRSFYNFELDTVCLDYTEYYDEGELVLAIK